MKWFEHKLAIFRFSNKLFKKVISKSKKIIININQRHHNPVYANLHFILFLRYSSMIKWINEKCNHKMSWKKY